ncbi:MAG: FAD-dependent oxidoreductase [Cyanobacteria bacterium]|nr:FAD-dependent oxidoreductase [Cyanobacteriota bacterium]
MLRLTELKLPLDHNEADLVAAACKRLRLPADALRGHQLVKRSIDARKSGQIQLAYSLDLELTPALEAKLLQRFSGDSHLGPSPDTRYEAPWQAPPQLRDRLGHNLPRPVVIGAGPCGYFAALLLAQMGLKPLLLERGQAIKQRSADTFGFWKRRSPFNPESNAQFGEGGAGTFSDGKLYSQVRDPGHRGRKVLEELVAAGANPEILVLHRPHIGTYKLATVVRGLRAQIEALGGEIRFGTRVQRLEVEAIDRPGAASDAFQQRVTGVTLADQSFIAADQVVLAVGHSARDTFTMLHQQAVAMELKPFSVGLRIEHPQALIDQARWGACAGHPRLGSAEYKLVHHASNGRGVYSFCMCPGGLVVGATSEVGRVVTNGMSQHSRNERNANSAIVVSIEPADVEPYGDGPGDPLAGIAFQRHWEEKAAALGLVRPSYEPGVRLTNLDSALPPFVIEALREALPAFNRTIPGYAMADAMLTGVETRTSSPLRLPRNGGFESINTRGLYPAGEGAGYAGGILSAAIDGIRVAEAVALTLRLQHPGEPGESACGPA